MTNNTDHTPKGWFYPSGLFVRLNWPYESTNRNYLPYLATFSHEQFHYLQHIGTSFGQFLSDMEDMWVNEILESVHFGLRLSNSFTLSINRWIEIEQETSVKKKLAQGINFYEKCTRLIEISTFGGPATNFPEFTELYRTILKYQLNRKDPTWYVDEERFPVDATEEPSEAGYFGSNTIMECAATFRQMSFAGKIDPRSKEVKELPSDIQDSFSDPLGKKAATSRAEKGAFSDYSEPYSLISGYLPEDPKEAINILFIILDLALMPPLGRFNSTSTLPPSFLDLLPSMRLFRAAEAVNRLGIRASDVINDYVNVVDTICTDARIRWPNPEWIAIKTPRLSVKRAGVENNAISDLQLMAGEIRKQHPGSFAFPGAPLINDLRTPVIYYSPDGVKTGVDKEQQVSLHLRYFKKLCAEAWICGKKPHIPSINGFDKSFEDIFGKVFGLSFKELERR